MWKYWNEHKSFVWKDDKSGKIVWVVSTMAKEKRILCWKGNSKYWRWFESKIVDRQSNDKFHVIYYSIVFLLRWICILQKTYKLSWIWKDGNKRCAMRMLEMYFKFELTIKVYEYLIINSALVFNKDWKQ